MAPAVRPRDGMRSVRGSTQAARRIGSARPAHSQRPVSACRRSRFRSCSRDIRRSANGFEATVYLRGVDGHAAEVQCGLSVEPEQWIEARTRARAIV